MSAADLEVVVREMVTEINAAAIARATSAQNIMRNVALEVLGQNGSGRVYRNGHVASAPGQPPAPQSSNLRKSWHQYNPLITGNGGGVRIILRMKNKMPYAKFLDPGTRYIAQRPFYKPIKEKSIPKIEALYANL